MNTRDLVIGLDFGSDSVRGVLLDTEGSVIATDSCLYPRWSEGKWRDDARMMYRQHPQDYLDAMTTVIKSITSEGDKSRIAAIAIDTTGSTPAAIDKCGNVLALNPEFAENPDAMFVLWKDHTAINEAALINRVAAETGAKYLDCCGGTYSEEWFYAKILRIIRNTPDVADAAATFAESSDYLPGTLAGITDFRVMPRNRCAASHKALWNKRWGGLPPEDFLYAIAPELGAIRSKLCNETICAGTKIGNLSPMWAEKLGLDTGVIIGMGAMDAHSGAVGAGIRPGMLLKSVGTSGSDLLVAKECDRTIPGICGQADGSIIPGMVAFEAGQAAVGDVFAWFRRILEYSGCTIDLRKLEKDAAESNDCNISALDFFAGRRTPECNPLMAGAITGLTLGCTAPDIYLALMRSVALGTRSIFEHYRKNNLDIDEVRVIGGVATKSPLLCQLMADSLQMEIKLVEQEQCCALGAGIFAAVAAGLFPDVSSAQKAMSPGVKRVFLPSSGKKEFYDRLFERYQRLAAFEESAAAQR